MTQQYTNNMNIISDAAVSDLVKYSAVLSRVRSLPGVVIKDPTRGSKWTQAVDPAAEGDKLFLHEHLPK